ncbi:SGNH/GDSL hydrolase family protein [Agaribacter marinus]|uniref:Hydrolase n=1 Tax=Agaribacter marinus TaxID=1431249 RepID=A0AA37T5N3_9ALTE|nr:SGNH/GDSL hydrolase family protein [Agaribacter marinus]GLR72668.1 hydrolase [Agaribacter marinus]
MKTILCYGDSNTWGAVPGKDQRYPTEMRWTGILADNLNNQYEVIVEGQSGRTTIHDDPFEKYKNGLTYLHPCLESHQPDLLILTLGTNDLKARFALNAYDIAYGVRVLAEEALNFRGCGGKKTKVLIVTPPKIIETGYYANMLKGGSAKSADFPKFYKQNAKELSCEYFNAAAFIGSSSIDGIHWDVDAHDKLGNELTNKIIKIFSA